MAVDEMVAEGSLLQPYLLLALQLLAAAAEGVLKFGGNLDVLAPEVLDNLVVVLIYLRDYPWEA